MSPPRWRIGTILYVGGIIAHHVALTFWTAAFLALARDHPEMQENEKRLASGEISKVEFEHRDMLARNNLAHVSFALCSVGELVVLAVLCAIILAIARGDPESNTRALSIVCAYAAGVWSKSARFYGLFVSPFRALSQAMISEVVPRGKEFLFFSLFAIVSQTSVVGFAVARAIIDRSGNTNLAFTFLLALGSVAMILLSRVDVEQSHYECRKYLEDEAVHVYHLRHGQVHEVAEKLAARDGVAMCSIRRDTLPL
ncbi:hypothetical protein CspHIS471_0610800 [Cutaneotrichosporon sp. HIS471]|nr:hypothetical protein CspHIS471_0610800 [Cutaneotrichosporon sp. HIS471]